MKIRFLKPSQAEVDDAVLWYDSQGCIPDFLQLSAQCNTSILLVIFNTQAACLYVPARRQATRPDRDGLAIFGNVCRQGSIVETGFKPVSTMTYIFKPH
ncbi:MAG: hypothetical protein NUV76_08370 [Candidatus Kuenenia sp.]|nr:hypothetical protein [Candidatus Kuenenia sp.]